MEPPQGVERRRKKESSNKEKRRVKSVGQKPIPLL
jgi:hypothetical protein